MGFFDKIGEVVGKVADVVSESVVPQVLNIVEPKVNEEVTEAVTEFRGYVEERVPQKAAEELKERETSDSVAVKVVAKALSGKADDLASIVLKFLKPQIDELTTSLPEGLTDKSMDQLREFLTLDDDDDEAKEAGTRDFDFSKEGDEGGATSTVGKALNLEGKLPRLKAKLKEKLQPIIDGLKGDVWDKMPDIFQSAVRELLQDASDEEGGDGGIDWVPDSIENAIEGKVVDQVPALTRAMEAPLRGVIDELCDFLQDKVSDKVEQQLRSALEAVHLL